MKSPGKNHNLPEILHEWIDFCSIGLYIADGNGYTIKVNKAYEKISGYKEAELIGRHLKELVDEKYFSSSAILKALEKQEEITQVGEAFKTNVFMISTATPLKNEYGEIYAVVAQHRDATEFNRLQLDYKRLQCELENAKKLNGDFFNSKTFLYDGRNIHGSKMQEVLRLAEQVASYDVPVYLYGESGVGKEVVAALIVNISPRHDKPFIKVNCSAIPHQLLESELFGYNPGAFTGASNTGKPGMFELADEGTILLDEIGDLPIDVQSKLLRVTQEQEIMRVGGTKPKSINVRIISATNKDLAELVSIGKFREDLYFRLNVVQIEIPPLRERKNEILSLAELFLKRFCEKYGLRKELSQEVKECLLGYHWPGNIRELQNQIENILVSSKINLVSYDDLPDRMKQKHIHATTNKAESVSLKEAVELYEQQLIEKALNDNKTIRGAARKLGINHSTLIRKMEKFNLHAKEHKSNIMVGKQTIG